MARKPTASISRLTFSGGNSIDLKPSDKIVLVGPNNSGKSQSLREINETASGAEHTRTLVIKSMDVRKVGSVEGLQKFLSAKATYVDGVYSYKDWRIREDRIRYWDNPYLTLGLAPGFMKNIAADDRLMICNVQGSISPTDQKSKPQHVLYDDPELMSEISGLFRDAFGEDIMFDFRGGSQLPIHVGELPQIPGEVDRVGSAYVAAVRGNPLLHEQGDGMKSYAGMLFEAVVANRDITLIDEPEAFLHPPQMRQLGKTLAAEVRGQLFVATHSSDIMRGFLEGTKGNLRILRIRREGNQNMVGEAPPEVIRKLWETPLLRYSNALEGIFHEQTIICEDDSDCRLLNSIGDYVAASRDELWRDTAYVPTGGKDRIPDVAGVLRQIGVPVKAVFDIDVLSEKGLIKDAVAAFGGEWEEVRPYWSRVDSAVRNGIRPKTIQETKTAIVALLEGTEEDDLPRGQILEIMKQNKSWRIVKQFGVSAIPDGDSQRDYEILKNKLEEIGIYLVPVGEIENFCREIGSHGPKFVTKLLSEKSFGDAKLAEPLMHMAPVRSTCCR